MSHPFINAEVKRKTKASLINHVLRVYPLAGANDPVAAAKETTYFYDHDAAKFTLSDKPTDNDTKPPGVANSNFVPFMTAAKKQFDDLIKVTKYKYTWDPAKFEIDHVVEVQHIIKMLVNAGHLDDIGWAKATLTSLLHLGFYVNDSRNLWNIPAALNQLKKYIPLASWYQNRTNFSDKDNSVAIATAQKDFIKQYLFTYTTKDSRTPFTELLELSAEMSGLPKTEMTWLTKAAGEELYKLLNGWADTAGISKQLALKTQKVNNPEQNMADMYGNEKESLLKKRKFLTEQAEKEGTLFAKDVDKVGHVSFDQATKKYKVSKEDSFADAIDQLPTSEEDDFYFDDSNWA